MSVPKRSASTVIYQKVNYSKESSKCQPKTQNDQDTGSWLIGSLPFLLVYQLWITTALPVHNLDVDSVLPIHTMDVQIVDGQSDLEYCGYPKLVY